MPSTLPEQVSDMLCLEKRMMQEFMEREIAGNEWNRIYWFVYLKWITVWWRRVGAGTEIPNNETTHHHQQSHRQRFGEAIVLLILTTANIVIDVQHA